MKVILVTAWRSKTLIPNRRFSVSIFSILALSLVLSLGAHVQADEAPDAAPSEKIHITADRMVVDNLARTAEFRGRVRAVQGTFVITSQSLIIYYRTANKASRVLSENSDSIERIVADGDVNILLDDKVATSATAEYRTDTRVLVLSGRGSRITSAKNSITGSKITFYREDERVIVEGQEDKRVEAEFYPQENESQ